MRSDSQKIVVVHGGARDNYQLALALEEYGLLEALVTDLYWPADASWARVVQRLLPHSLQRTLLQRSKKGLPAHRVKQAAWSGLSAHIADRLPGVPMSWRRAIRRWSDARLGNIAGRLAGRRGARLISYSYYGYHALRAYGRPATLFQLHPHPGTMRFLLQRELDDHPECAASLLQEWELAVPQSDFDRLVEESRIANRYLVASSFSKQSLIQNGVSADAITVIPYGVDLQRFHVPPTRTHTGTLQLLFVGRINQRKGVSYLLEAMRHFTSADVHLTVCGRVVDDLQIFAEFSQQITIRPSVSTQELVQAYQSADLFVFASVGEGFGQVLLESMACGLPILSTTHTAAPDLIEDGVQGFVIEPRRPDLLVKHIRWAAEHRQELAQMGRLARLRAEQFPWQRFRARVAEAVMAQS